MHDRWVLLAYRLPREPSSPRIAVWRKLRRLGAAQLQDGLVALPLDSRTREQLEWIADEVADAGGDAQLWTAEPTSSRQGRELAKRLADAIAAEYSAIEQEAAAMTGEGSSARRRAVRRLRAELRRIRSRDYFPPPERDAAIEAVEALARVDEVVA